MGQGCPGSGHPYPWALALARARARTLARTLVLTRTLRLRRWEVEDYPRGRAALLVALEGSPHNVCMRLQLATMISRFPDSEEESDLVIARYNEGMDEVLAMGDDLNVANLTNTSGLHAYNMCLFSTFYHSFCTPPHRAQTSDERSLHVPATHTWSALTRLSFALGRPQRRLPGVHLQALPRRHQGFPPPPRAALPTDPPRRRRRAARVRPPAAAGDRLRLLRRRITPGALRLLTLTPTLPPTPTLTLPPTLTPTRCPQTSAGCLTACRARYGRCGPHLQTVNPNPPPTPTPTQP